MPKFDKKVVITGDQRPVLDVVTMASVVVRFARTQEAKLRKRQPSGAASSPDAGAAA